MENEQQNVASATPDAPLPKKREGVTGQIVAIIVILAVLAVGGWYYFNQSGLQKEAGPAATAEELQKSSDPAVQAMLQQGTSDDPASIEADVNATDFSAIDASAAAIEASSAQ